MSALILVEHNNQTMHPSVRHVLTATLTLAESPVLLVVGYNCHEVVKEVSSLQGVGAVWHVDNLCYEHQLAENLSTLIVKLALSFTYIVSGSTTFGKNVLPRVAALFDVAQISDVTRVVSNDTFEHPIYAGNALETVQSLDEKIVLTIRPTAFDAVMETQNTCSIERIEAAHSQEQSKFLHHALSQSSRPDLSHAKIIVSGGRGLQSAEKFKLIEALADVLGAAIGASRAAVDAGFVPNDYQVGQTGKIVAPELYIAIGISGAVQHIAGMKDSKIIVAINKDEDAPIFQLADYGLVGDLFTLVPELIEEIKTIN